MIQWCPVCEEGVAYPLRDSYQAWDRCTNGCEFVNQDRTEVLQYQRRLRAGEVLNDDELEQLIQAYLRSQGREAEI